MADFIPPFERMLINEGGMVLHTVKNDRGGQTFAGIARKANPNWEGWDLIDRGDKPPVEMVRKFYKKTYWDAMRLDEVLQKEVARTMFDFGVNAGIGTSTKLTQLVLGTTPDGVIGPTTLALLNGVNVDMFMAKFALAKLARYEQIVSRDPSQREFLLGWVRRTLKEAT
jgi:lysozyme family protein